VDAAVFGGVVDTRRPGHRFDENHKSAGAYYVGHPGNIRSRGQDSLKYQDPGDGKQCGQQLTGPHGGLKRGRAYRTQRVTLTISDCEQVAKAAARCLNWLVRITSTAVADPGHYHHLSGTLVSE
jgi:hypothetical protein